MKAKIIGWVSAGVLAGSALAMAAATAGSPAPDFVLNSLSGKEVKLSNYREARVVVLGLFHICDPCRKQSVELQKIQDAFKDKDVTVIGVNAAGDGRAEVEAFLKTVPGGVHFTYLLDPERTLEGPFTLRATPTILIIDKKGVIRFRASSVPAAFIEQELKKIL